MKFREWLAQWYMARIAGRYCPCEWPIKSRRLIRLCGRIDDVADRAEFRRFCAFVLAEHQNTSSSSSSVDAKIKWRRS